MEQEIWRKVNEEGFEDLYEISNFGRGRSLDRYVKSGRGDGIRLMNGKIMGQHKDDRYLFMVLTDLEHTHINRHYHILVAKAFPDICGKWFKGAVVHHKDFNQYNNRADNLQVMTDEEHRAIHKNSDETFKRRSEGTKRWINEKGHPLKGKHHSDETKKKISIANKKYTDEELRERRKEMERKKYWENKGKIIIPKKVRITSVKPILQYTLDGEFVAEYQNISEASRQTGICRKAINNCVNQKVHTKNGYTWVSKTAGGSIWKYKNN